MRRSVLRVATVFALVTSLPLLAGLIWGGRSAMRAEAQQTGARGGVSSSTDVATASANSASFSTSTSTPAKTGPTVPVVVASGAQYANARGLATDAAGGLYISLSATPPSKNCVTSSLSPAVSSSTGSAKLALTIFSNCTLAPTEDPSGVAVAPGNQIYLANRTQSTIRLLNMLTGKVAAIPQGAGSSGAAHASSSNADPFEPAGLASDRLGNLYVADRGNNRVLGFTPDAAHFTYLAHVLDAAAVAVDAASGQLYVASPATNRVFVIDLNKSDVNVFAGSGAFNGGAGAADAAAEFNSAPESAELGAPEGVAVDGQGNVFIADTGANALVRVDAKSGELSRVAIQGNLNSPGAVAIDRSGDVFVADRGNDRVLEFPQMGAGDPPANIVLSPSSFNFGNQPTGGSTPVQVFTLTNNSSSAIALNNLSFTFVGADPLDFTETNTCVPSLAVGASCNVSVTFTPGGTGARSATLEVTDSDASSPQTAALTGTGDDFELTVPNVFTDTVANVTPGQNASFSISVTPDNVFSGTVNLECPAVLSAHTQTITCTIQPASVNVTPGQAQQFTVTFTTQGPNATRIIPAVRRVGPGARARFLLMMSLAAMMLALCALALRRAAVAEMFDARKKRRARFAALCFALLAGVAAAGCKNNAFFNPNETQEGSYPLLITGTAQNAGRSITLILNVD